MLTIYGMNATEQENFPNLIKNPKVKFDVTYEDDWLDDTLSQKLNSLGVWSV